MKQEASIISKMGHPTSTAMDNDDQSLDTPRDGGKLNSDKYFKKVADYIKSSLNRDMTKKVTCTPFKNRYVSLSYTGLTKKSNFG